MKKHLEKGATELTHIVYAVDVIVLRLCEPWMENPERTGMYSQRP